MYVAEVSMYLSSSSEPSGTIRGPVLGSCSLACSECSVCLRSFAAYQHRRTLHWAIKQHGYGISGVVSRQQWRRFALSYCLY